MRRKKLQHIAGKFIFSIFFSLYLHNLICFYFKSDNEIVSDEVLKKLFQKQIELESNLSNLLAEKEHVFKNLKETTNLVKNEIISQYKVNLFNKELYFKISVNKLLCHIYIFVCIYLYLHVQIS